MLARCRQFICDFSVLQEEQHARLACVLVVRRVPRPTARLIGAVCKRYIWVAWQIVICVSVRVCKRYIWVLAVMRELLRCLFVAV